MACVCMALRNDHKSPQQKKNNVIPLKVGQEQYPPNLFFGLKLNLNLVRFIAMTEVIRWRERNKKLLTHALTF